MTAKIVEPLHIPPFYCPIPPAVHPELERIDGRSIEWFRSFGAFPGDEGLKILRGWHHPELAARAHPEEDPERVQLMADLVHWTIFDDAVIDGDHSHTADTASKAAGGFPALAVKLVRMLEAPDGPLLLASPWVSALMDLRRRLDAIATPAQIHRWVGAFREYLLAAGWKRFSQAKRELPRLADYVAMRTPDGGVQLYVTLADVIGGYQLTDADLAHPQVRALTEMALTLIAWDNDLFSHYKESLTEDPCINLVDVIAAERGCSLQDAVPLAMAMRDRVMTRYMAVRDAAVSRHDGAARRYITTLDRWIASNIDMSANSDRYINPRNRPATEVAWVHFEPARTDTPSEGHALPLEFPAIGWWWRKELHAGPFR
ncbi:terpene synthase family protein [Polyangium aurulentum]|uniref:terpene synthase family protein n=1 Tax=Polyangium aurulentum TaxID=2567896 RepID=UPI0010ADB925|nr:hypothetical protein [Polyangium aurulentum]UQA57273.1 hypothetical protein E8A73_039240 [Polyangium aurulentum]